MSAQNASVADSPVSTFMLTVVSSVVFTSSSVTAVAVLAQVINLSSCQKFEFSLLDTEHLPVPLSLKSELEFSFKSVS